MGDLSSYEISRFKSIKDATLDFGRVNIFIGGNGAGKSNILEAIGLTSACLGRGLGDSDIASKGLRITPSELMKSSFKDEDLPKTLALKACFRDNINYTATLRSSELDPLMRFSSETASNDIGKIFSRSPHGAKVFNSRQALEPEGYRGMWDQISTSFKVHGIPNNVANAFSEFSRYAIYQPQTDLLRGRVSGRVDSPPIGLHGEGLSSAVEGYLKTLNQLRRSKVSDDSENTNLKILEECTEMVWIPGWAGEFGVRPSDSQFISRDIATNSKNVVYFKDRFMKASRNQLSAYDSSEGTLFLLFCAIILAHPSAPKIFAVDNVDNALNPGMTRKLLEHIINVTLLATEFETDLGARQIFLASHNPTALDAFDIFDDEQKIFVVRRVEKGHTIIDPLVPKKGMTRNDWILAADGRNLSQYWLDGKIKGALKPNPTERPA